MIDTVIMRRSRAGLDGLLAPTAPAEFIPLKVYTALCTLPCVHCPPRLHGRFPMRWDDLRRSSNVEDYRGTSFGGPGLKLGVGGTLVVVALAYFFGVDPSVIL